LGQKFIELADVWIQSLGPWGYLMLAAAALVEYIFPPFPGDSMMALCGIWAWRTHQSWLGVLAAVSLGNALGIGLQHRIGHILIQRIQGSKSGQKSGWIAKKLIAWGLSEEHIAAVQERMRRRGVTLLLINRFLPSFRALVFLAAGASGMSFKTTLFWGVLGSLAWSAFILGIGAWVGGNAERMLMLLERYQTAAAWAVGSAVVIWVLYILYKRKR
jgi:membrane protein DedA with SNARE-associated domain